MARLGFLQLVCILLTLSPLPACHRESSVTSPPETRRPIIKNEAELAAERDQRIRSGLVVPTSGPAAPVGDAERTPVMPAPVVVSPGAIEADLLLINDAALTLPEIIYPVRARLIELRKAHTAEGFVEVAQRLLRARIQQEVGALLIYREAIAKLTDPQREIIKQAVDKELSTRISRDFGGSIARFERHLSRFGLTRDQYRTQLERDLVARQYTREKLLPQISVPRNELLTYYRRNPGQYFSEETRALEMIEAPFEAFLPDGTTWANASPNVRAQARLRAARHIREAHARLADQSFAEVARAYSKGIHAAQGGAWGEISRPLQAPYDKISAKVFELPEGQVSEPLEVEAGWYLVRCARITPARQVAFADAQDEIRQELTERKFDRLSADYMIRLSEKATLSGLETFLKAGVRRAQELPADEETP